MIWLIDSAGARIDPNAAPHPDYLSTFADSGYLFREQVVMSGVVPQVAALVGPGGQPDGVIGVMRDITEVKAREEQWAETTARLREELASLRKQMQERYGFSNILGFIAL